MKPLNVLYDRLDFKSGGLFAATDEPSACRNRSDWVEKGDMFPDIDEEEQVVSQGHLKWIQDLLYGDAGIQKKLFFHSYRFDIIPLDLISSIYEEFYHGATDDFEKKQNRFVLLMQLMG